MPLCEQGARSLVYRRNERRKKVGENCAIHAWRHWTLDGL